MKTKGAQPTASSKLKHNCYTQRLAALFIFIRMKKRVLRESIPKLSNAFRTQAQAKSGGTLPNPPSSDVKFL